MITRASTRHVGYGSRACWIVALAVLAAVSSVAARPVQLDFDIGAQSLSSALIEFGDQADVTVGVADGTPVDGVDTERVLGTYTVDEAMTRLLSGSGLEHVWSEDSSIVVREQAPEPAEPDPQPQEDASREEPPPEAEAGGEIPEELSRFIGEVIVTAEKRESSLQDTPLAITAITSETIERSQVREARDVATLAPSLTFIEGTAGALVYLRGVGQAAPASGFSPGVAFYLDGVFLGKMFMNAAAFYDADRIEVLRGPQGTLYGRNSTGGNINIVTKSPSFQRGLNVSMGYGDYDTKLVQAAITGPVIEERLALRGSVVYEQRDGWVDNLVTGNDVYDKKLQSYAFSALWTPNDSVALLLRADYQDGTELYRPLTYLEGVPGSGLDPTTIGAQTGRYNRGIVYNNSDNPRDETYWGLNGTLTWDVSDHLIFKSITAYRDSEKVAVNHDWDGTDFDVSEADTEDFVEELTQEINLSGTAGPADRLSWITGINYYQSDLTAFAEVRLPFFRPFFTLLPKPTLKGEVLDVPWISTLGLEDLTSVGVFAQGTYSVGDDLRLTAGARYTADEKDVTRTSRSNFNPAGCEALQESKDWSATTWKLGADYRLSEPAMIYGSVSTGFKAGGFNTGNCNPPFGEENILAYEAGIKSTLLDGRLVLNGAAFYYDYTDLQVRKLIADGANIIIAISNAGDARVTGAELEFVALPTPSFRLDGGIAFLDAKFTRAELDDPMVPGRNEEDISGNRMERAPEVKWNLGVQVRISKFDIRYDVSYSDYFFVDQFESDFSRIDSFLVQNATLSWRPKSNDRFVVELFVKNLADEEYLDLLLPVALYGGTQGIFAAPRRGGIRFRWNGGF